jgi:Protein kinase domain
MDADTSSPSSGQLTSQQELEMESHLGKRFKEPEPESEDSSSYSVTARWRKRAAKYEEFERTVQQWCQQDTLALTDQQLPAPSDFMFGQQPILCSDLASCAMCKAIAELNASRESFVKSNEEYSAAKKELAEAETEHVEAKKEHAEAENQVMLNGPSSHSDRILELLTRLVADKAGRVADKARLVARDASTISDKASLVARDAKAIYTAHCEVKSLLGALRAAGNEATLVTKESRGTRSTISLDKTRFDAKPQSSPSKFDKLCNPSAIEFSETDFLHTLTSEQKDLLTSFYNDLKLVFEKASMLHGINTQYRRKIKKTVNGIIGWKAGDRIELSKTRFYIPGYVGQERDGVQPILYAIMVKMAQVLRLGPQITSEQGIPRVENRRGRYIDFVVNSSAEEYLFAILPAMLGVPIEVKPITRKDTTVDKLLLEAQNQVVGHLAKRAIFSFDFGGIGEDCTVFGLELTMASITVVVLKLSGVGTANVQVTAQRTKRVPLFDKDIREKLFGAKARDVEASFEIEEKPQGLPEGFCLLARTLMSVNDGLGKSPIKDCHHRFSMCSHGAESINLVKYLGSGAFSHVLKLGVEGSNDVFIKVPKSYRMKKSLEGEAEVLKHLCGHRCIPQLYDTDNPIKTLDIRIKCEISALPCLPLRGLIGKPASEQDYWDSNKLRTVFSEVSAALEYAHGKGWAHLDVRPSNIITITDAGPSGDGSRVMLIDWGCAHRTTAKLKGFIGCPPYAHDELFGQVKEWYPCVDHDLASLAYSVASLSHGCIPWSGFSNHRAVPDDVRKRRFDLASTALEPLLREWNVAANVKEALLKAIGKSPQARRKRSHGSL